MRASMQRGATGEQPDNDLQGIVQVLQAVGRRRERNAKPAVLTGNALPFLRDHAKRR